MGSVSVTASTTSATFEVTTSGAPGNQTWTHIRIAYRKNSETAATYINKQYNKGESDTFEITVRGLASGTTYVYTVYELYNYSSEKLPDTMGMTTIVSGATFKTSTPSEPEETSTKVWIRVNGNWVQATPWVYDDDEWKEVKTAWIYNGGWKQC